MKAETRRKEVGMGDGTPQPPMPPQGTHRGAEGGHPPVPGGDGEVIEGDVLAVQLGILPHPQLPFHRGDHKFPCRRQQGPGLHHAAASGPAPQGNDLICDGGQAPGRVWGQNHDPLLEIWEDCGSRRLSWMHPQVPAGAGGGLNGQIKGACAPWLGLSEDANSPLSTCPCPVMARSGWATWRGPPWTCSGKALQWGQLGDGTGLCLPDTLG